MQEPVTLSRQRQEDLRRAVEALGEDPSWLSGLASQITDAIHAEMPELDADPELRRGTHASTEGVLRTFVEMVFAGQDPEEAEMPPAAVEYAREFVRRGLPLDSLLRTYYIGHATFFRLWVAQLREVLDDPVELTHAIEAGGSWSFAYIDTLSRGLVQRYADERDRWVRSAAALRLDITERLLGSAPVDLGQAEAQLGYRLGRSHLAFVVWGDPNDERDQDLGAIERAASEVGGLQVSAQPLLVPFGSDLVAGWIGGPGLPDASALESARFDVAKESGLRVAFGASAEGIEGFRRSHQQARYARRVALLQGDEPGSVTLYDRVALTALASADLDHARDFVSAELGPLADGDQNTRRLAATLMVYLEERSSPKRAAKRLGVHENTIPNRIRAAQALLERPIDERAAELLVALRLRSTLD
jgi:GGDEF-like domain/PucR C-terminal helix-turn-helix domain